MDRMEFAQSTFGDAVAPPGSSRMLRVAIVGGGTRGAQILELLRDVPQVVVAGFTDPDPSAVGMRRAEQSGIFTTTELDELYQLPELDVIIDTTGDQSWRERILAGKPRRIELVGDRGVELVWDLLKARRKGEEQERLFAELQVAYDRIRGHERELQAHKSELENANMELEKRLAEIFFTHEFFKALASYQAVREVCGLIVDGANGILGAEISCAYLADVEAHQLFLGASQGRPLTAFRERLDFGESVVGRVAQSRQVAITLEATEADRTDTAWAVDPADVTSQVAHELHIGEKLLGVLVIASSVRREFTPQELNRIEAICNMSSLALQNALFHEELERLSVTDRLTDLYNHGYFQLRLEEEIARAHRFEHELSVIMLDIDYFKAFNDAYGHPKGDQVLKTIAGVTRKNMREVDVAARYGGEEFVIILPETGEEGAMYVAERIRSGVEAATFEVNGGERIHKTVSIGVATYGQHADTQPALIEAADQAMYTAKRNGRNHVVSASALSADRPRMR